MNSPLTAIVWEFWWRHRRAWMALGLVVPVVLFLQQVLGLGASKLLGMLEVFAALFSAATVAWIFSYAEPDEGGRHGGFPFRMYRMPVATWKLVACPIGLGAGAMLALYLVWAGVFASGLELEWRPRAMATQAMTLLALQSSLQAVIWCLYQFPWIRVGALILVTCGLAGVSMAAPDNGYYGLGWAGFNVLLGLTILGSMGAAWLGVERDRRGGWKGWTGRWLEAMAEAWPLRRRPFGSKQQAQFWLEWRRKALFPGFLLGAAMAATVSIFPIPAILHLDSAEKLMAYAGLPLMSWTIAFSIGFSLAKKDWWTRDLTLPAFLGVRPIRTADLVLAKMKCAAVVVVLGWGVFSALSIPSFHAFHGLTSEEMELPSWQSFREANRALVAWAFHPGAILTALALTWKWVVESMSIGLSGRSGMILRRGIADVLIMLTFLVMVAWLAENQSARQFLIQGLPLATALVVALKLALAIRSLIQVRRKGLYDGRQTRFLVLLWAALTGCVLASALRFPLEVGLAPALVWFCAALLLPAGELFTCVLHLDANRHR